jgi:hypothetical protein
VSDPGTTLERSTKLAILISLFAAVWLQASAIGLSTAAVAAFVGAWALGRRRPVLARQAALFLTYLFPAVFVSTRERFLEENAVVCVALLCGVMFSGGAPMRWSLPWRWRLPLAFWGVLAACTWPIVALREADFYVDQLPLSDLWPATVAMGVMFGLVWFDWLYAAYGASGSSDQTAFEREVLLPLGLAWVVTAAAGLYQMFGRMTLLNPGFWVSARRATGLLGDANVFGVLSAMWGPALAAVAVTRSSQHRGWWLATSALPLSWLAVWASGSRSSLALVILGLGGLLIAIWRTARSTRIALAFAAGTVAVLVLGVVAVSHSGAPVIGPVARVLSGFSPEWSVKWVRQIGTSLWIRDGYGTIAMEMIRRFPSVGVGLSSFYGLVPLFSWILFHKRMPFDNAQNWYRHELAELGIVGSLGWIVWTVSVLALILIARSRPGRQVSSTVVRFLLLGFGLVSLVGMPGQSLLVAFTFWTLAFWFLLTVADVPQPLEHQWQRSTMAWLALWLLIAGHAAGTAYVGWTALRPPVRALRANMDYSLGFYLPEDQGPDAFRWAKTRAVVVLPSTNAWMEVTVKVNHPNLDRQPVDVKVWVDGASRLRTRLRSVSPVTRYVRVPANAEVMIETWVSRLHGPEPGVNDRRDRGLLVRWKFVDAPPPDAVIAGS